MEKIVIIVKKAWQIITSIKKKKKKKNIGFLEFFDGECYKKNRSKGPDTKQEKGNVNI
jgi:hypothetical protein